MDNVKEQFLIMFTTPLYVGVILFEMILSHYKHRGAYTFKDTVTNLYLMILNSAVDLGFRLFYLVVFQILFAHRIFEFENPLWYWFWLVVGMDFLYYWLHRIDHVQRLVTDARVTSVHGLVGDVGGRNSAYRARR